jgi:hypothetical protein
MKVLFLVIFWFSFATAHNLIEKFSWQDLEFSWPSSQAKEAALRDGSYVVKNNLPLAFDIWKNKMFFTVPRWRKGVASSLNYIELSGEKSPTFHPFPSWEFNKLQQGASGDPKIVSGFGIRGN